jgi:peptidoglycan/LPS O-acetylase OafA/YrhL
MWMPFDWSALSVKRKRYKNMTDLLSIMFAIGIALILSALSVILKNTIFSIVSGLGWALVAMYMFNVSSQGDPDIGVFAWGLGMMAVILTLAMFLQGWWLSRKKTLQMSNDKTGETFYTEGDPEFKEINDMYKARANKKKLRGR